MRFAHNTNIKRQYEYIWIADRLNYVISYLSILFLHNPIV